MKKQKQLAFKLGTSEVIRRYLRFLVYHHNYTTDKLLEVFPEYVTEAKDSKQFWKFW